MPDNAKKMSPRVLHAVRALQAGDLPRLSAGSAGLHYRLARGAGVTRGEHRWQWRPREPVVAGDFVTLTAPGLQIALLIDEDLAPAQQSLADWRADHADWRTLAWTANHEWLLDLAQAVFGADLLAHSVIEIETPEPDFEVTARAGFEICDAEATVLVRGEALLNRRAALQAARRTPLPVATARLNDIPVCFGIELDTVDVSATELRNISRGALLRLSNESLAGAEAPVALAAGPWRIAATVRGRELTIERIDPVPTAPHSTLLRGPLHMIDRDVQPEAGDDAPAAPPSELATLPVRLRFCAGQVSLPLATAQSLATGQVIPLPRRLTDTPVTVFANDTAIARGELVLIGDVLGVRVAQMLGEPG